MLDISIHAIKQEYSCSVRKFSSDANPARMDGLADDTKLINDLCAWAGVKPSRLASDLGMAATTLTRPANGKATTRIGRQTLESLRAAYPQFPGWNDDSSKAPDIALTLQSDNGSVPLRHLDLGLAMGDGTSLEDYYEEGIFEFDAALLRKISRAPPHRLIVGHGVGDSMMPTLLNEDMVIFDTTQTVLNAMDKIWAINIYGQGAVKRIRKINNNRVLVMSDNPTLSPQEVDADDLRILGRVIWSARRH